MSVAKQATKSSITLRGSAQMVAEFFGYSINSILFQRGVYDPDSFQIVKKYGMKLQTTKDEGLSSYLSKVLAQLAEWIAADQVKKLVLVITSTQNQEVLERWVFDVESEKQSQPSADGAAAAGAAESKHGGSAAGRVDTGFKDEKEIQKEIACILRQITSSVTFLPMMDVPVTFDLLVYTPTQTAVPGEWEESDPRYITRSNEVRLRSFSTSVHKVDTLVAYKVDD